MKKKHLISVFIIICIITNIIVIVGASIIYLNTRQKREDLWQERGYLNGQMDMIQEIRENLWYKSDGHFWSWTNLINSKWVKYKTYYYVEKNWIKTIMVHE